MYEYDYENRITKITKDETNIAEFAYDALGRRIKKVDSVAGTTNTYYYNDKWQVLLECDGIGTQQRWFAYGNYIDETLMMGTNTSVLSLKLYVHDHLFSPVALIQRYHVEVKERYEYDAYGNCQIMDASYNPRSSSIYGNPYYLTGRNMDFLDGGNLWLMIYRHRYYDTYTGRFLTHDPLGITPNPRRPNKWGPSDQYDDAMSLYEYARGAPCHQGDPHGLGWIEPGIPDEEILDPPEAGIKQMMYLFARHVLIRKKHWRDLLDAWYYESKGPEVTYEGFGHQTVRDIASNAGFQRLLSCWVAKYVGCYSEIPEEGVHFNLQEKSFYWHYYYPDPTVPGGLLAYTDATDFLGSYTAWVDVKKKEGCYVNVKVTVKNLTDWPSACKTLKFFKDSWIGGILPDYPAHAQHAGPFSPSRGGNLKQNYIFEVKNVPVNPTTYGAWRACMTLR